MATISKVKVGSTTYDITLPGLTASVTELNYADGVTSNIQTQLGAKVNKAGDTMTGELNMSSNAIKGVGEFCLGNKTGYHDGNTGVYMHPGGYIHLQRSSSSNGTAVHPYIGFYVDDATEYNSAIRHNSTNNAMQFLYADHYYFDSNLLMPNNNKIYATASDGSTREAFNPANSSNQCVVGAGNYSAGDADTSIRGRNVYIYSSAAGGNFIPYMKAGDKINCNISTAGFVTSSKIKVYFTVQTDRYRIGEPTVTATSNNGLIIRQDGNYTHGSAASTWVKPSSYTADENYAGIEIVATMSSTTNAVNNSACGVMWSGYLTIS